ncbi:MAG: hypothetical protein IJM45_08860, partial [Clostridia bacterium]|nr:hypothetical protein [Clostridia bacterium]
MTLNKKRVLSFILSAVMLLTMIPVGVFGADIVDSGTSGNEELTTDHSDEPFAVIPGDVDLDGDVTAIDARFALRIVAKLEDCTATQAKAADVDGNSVINALDARIILRWAASLDEDVTDPPGGSQEVSAYSVGDKIQFGTYPQSEVTDSATLDRLNATDTQWISYGYYSGTGNLDDGKMTSSDYMQYRDAVVGGVKYRAVRFSSYRPNETWQKSLASTSIQDTNGYYTDTVYWFRFEPIIWRILDPSNGLAVCDSIIDAQPFSNYVISKKSVCYNDKGSFANNYTDSSIRAWLNDEFYNTAFTDAQKANIKDDSVFLLSYSSVLNSRYGYSGSDSRSKTREASGSDYSKCQGLMVWDAYGHYGNSDWWLSSEGKPFKSVYSVLDDGRVSDGYAYADEIHGVRPALRFFNLKSDFSQYEVPTVSAVSDKTEVTVGDEITVTVKVDNAAGLDQGSAWLSFDTSLFELLSTDKGDTSASNVFSYEDDEIAQANTEGRIHNSFAYTDSETQDTVTIYTATFKAKGAGTASFGFVADELMNLTVDSVATVTVDHAWNDGVITTAATCSSEGVKTYTCSVCGTTKTETIDKDASNHVGGTELRNVKAATCGDDGYTGDTYCKGCGAKLTSGTVVNKTGHHSWNNGKVTKAATCSSEGVKTYTCTVCKATKTESIAKNLANHAGGTELRNVKAATSTEDGYTGDTYCKGCGAKLSSGKIIPAIKVPTVSAVSNKTYVAVGDEVTVTVKIDNAVGLEEGSAWLSFDTSLFELLRTGNGDISASNVFSYEDDEIAQSNSEGMIHNFFLYYVGSETKDTVTIYTATFKAKRAGTAAFGFVADELLNLTVGNTATVTINAQSAKAPTVSAVSDKTEVAVGDEVTVTVKIDNAVGLEEGAAWLSFDTSLFELLRTGNGDISASNVFS